MNNNKKINNPIITLAILILIILVVVLIFYLLYRFHVFDLILKKKMNNRKKMKDHGHHNEEEDFPNLLNNDLIENEELDNSLNKRSSKNTLQRKSKSDIIELNKKILRDNEYIRDINKKINMMNNNKYDVTPQETLFQQSNSSPFFDTLQASMKNMTDNLLMLNDQKNNFNKEEGKDAFNKMFKNNVSIMEQEEQPSFQPMVQEEYFPYVQQEEQQTFKSMNQQQEES